MTLFAPNSAAPVLLLILAMTTTSVLLRLPTSVDGFVPSITTHFSSRTSSRKYYLYFQDGDMLSSGGGGASPLELSGNDIARFRSLASRQITAVPAMILDCMVPGQELSLASSDPVVHELLEYCEKKNHSNKNKIAMLGMNVNTGKPLAHGVIAEIERIPTSSTTKTSSSSSSVAIKVKAQQRMQVQSIDSEEEEEDVSFQMADCEITENRYELMDDDEEEAATVLAEQLPSMMKSWKSAIVQAGVVDAETLQARERILGGMPTNTSSNEENDNTYWNKLAIYTAAMLNPIPSAANNDFLDIRPAMLAATTPFQRLLLATAGLNNAICKLQKRKH